MTIMKVTIMKMLRAAMLPVMVICLISMVAPSASAADVFDLNILNCNCVPSGTVAGTVTLTTVSATMVDFTVHLNAPLNIHDTTSFNAFAFSYSGSGTLSASNITTNFAFTTTPNAGAMDGSGHNFEYFLNWTGGSVTGGNTGVTDLSFRITSTVAVTLAEFETLNGNNADFAVSVSNTQTSGCTGVVSGGNGTSQSTPSGGSTGEISPSCGGTTVPEPSSALTLMLGFGLLALSLSSRKIAARIRS
jgi:hypothetical protein